METHQKEKKSLNSFNPEEDAEHLHTAIRGLGTDDKTLIEIISKRPRHYLAKVKEEYKIQSHHGHTLEQGIIGDTSGHYRNLLINLITDRNLVFAHQIRDSIKGLIHHENVLEQVIFTQSEIRLKKIILVYKQEYQSDMEHDVLDELSGEVKKLFQVVLSCPHQDDHVNEGLAISDADLLYKKGEGKIGTDEDAFIKVLTSRNKLHIQAICQAYLKKTGHSLEQGIRSEMTGHLRDALITLITPLDEFWADKVHVALRGICNDAQLVRIFGSLSKGTLKKVNECYLKKYGKTMIKAVEDHASGNYKKLLHAILS